MSSSIDLAAAVVSALSAGGVRDVVLAPGSRSAPLAIAFHQADGEGILRLHVRVDERSAGFLALGLAKGSHRPVAVVTTSGTAVANLHPAVLEAVHAGETLLVLSGDRPAELRGTGANQTTEQVEIFGARVPSIDVAPGDIAEMRTALADAVGRRGPTQLNLQFADPLLPSSLPIEWPDTDRGAGPGAPAETPNGRRSRFQVRQPHAASPRDAASPRGAASPRDAASPHSAAPPHRAVSLHSEPVQLALGPRTVVVAGDDAGPPARLMAQKANWPLLAEPTSGARTGTHALRTYRLLLAGELGDQIERVVVTGHPTLSRPVTRLISRPDIEVLSVRGPGGVCTDPGRVARHLDAMPDVEGSDDAAWINLWRAADARLAAAVDALAAEPGGLVLQVAAEVAAAVPAEGLLVVGSSQPVRDLDVMSAPFVAGERRLVIGNRGLAGIDGMVSTAIGAALGRRSSRSLAYMGDVTFLHDANGLIRGPSEPCPDLTIVVANDDGGSIFSTLEQGAATYAEAFERVFGTPHGMSLQALCTASGTSYERAEDAATLREMLAVEASGLRVVEVPLDRTGRRHLDERLRSLA